MKVNNLSLYINNDLLLSDISFKANKGDIIGVVGYSGAGKTTLLKSIANINGQATGDVKYSGKLGFLYQNAKHSIAPNYKIINQCCDGVGKRNSAQKLLQKLGLSNQQDSYVDLISGGQQMRSSLAINLHRKPNVLLLDEPTANLDKQNTQIVVKELLQYVKKTKCILIWVSHDMDLIKKVSHKILHLDDGQLIEYNTTKKFFAQPRTIQGKDLLGKVKIKPSKNKIGEKICEFKNVSLGYNENTIIDDLSFTIGKGECVGLLGNSGMGKTTILRGVMGQLKPKEGSIIKPANIQMVFQDVRGSLNPKLNIFQNVSEPISGIYNKQEIIKKVVDILYSVGINKDRIYDYPHQFSGGECQRISIARAFISNPDLILADEITSALDSYNKNIVLKLINELQLKYSTAIIFSSHDNDSLNAVSHKVINL